MCPFLHGLEHARQFAVFGVPKKVGPSEKHPNQGAFDLVPLASKKGPRRMGDLWLFSHVLREPTESGPILFCFPEAAGGRADSAGIPRSIGQCENWIRSRGPRFANGLRMDTETCTVVVVGKPFFFFLFNVFLVLVKLSGGNPTTQLLKVNLLLPFQRQPSKGNKL